MNLSPVTLDQASFDFPDTFPGVNTAEALGVALANDDALGGLSSPVTEREARVVVSEWASGFNLRIDEGDAIARSYMARRNAKAVRP